MDSPLTVAVIAAGVGAVITTLMSQVVIPFFKKLKKRFGDKRVDKRVAIILQGLTGGLLFFILAFILAYILIKPTPLSPCPPLARPPFAPYSVTITSPAANSKVTGLIIAQGTACNIPQGKELWLFVETAGISGYFPQGDVKNPTPIVVSNDEWTVSALIGGPADSGRQFVLHMALVDQKSAGRAAIVRYFADGYNTGKYTPITKNKNHLPAGIDLISQVPVVRQ